MHRAARPERDGRPPETADSSSFHNRPAGYMPLCVVVRRAQDRLVIPFIPRGSVMPQPVVHFELPADDVERARTFYRDAFGWNVITVPDMDYTLLGTATTTDDMGRPTAAGEINGGMFARTEDLTQPLITIAVEDIDRKSTRLNSSHVEISYAVFCLKKKKKK